MYANLASSAFLLRFGAPQPAGQPPSFGKALLGKHEANSPLERFVSLMTMRSAPYNQRS